MIEQRHGVKNRMLVLPQEARHRDPIEHDARRGASVPRIEGTIWRERDIIDSAAIKRCKERGKPARMFIQNGKIGHSNPGFLCADAGVGNGVIRGYFHNRRGWGNACRKNILRSALWRAIFRSEDLTHSLTSGRRLQVP